MAIPDPQWLLAICALIGLAAAVLGLGGGVFLIPLLILWGDVPPVHAAATSLVCCLVTSASGSVAFDKSRLADLRLVATSIQFGHSYNGWESWTLFPHERERMIDLIRRTGASGVVFLSGDVHWGEINRQEVPGGYPLHDVTASGLNNDWDGIEPSTRRLGPAVPEYNFGSIEIDWSAPDPTLRLLSIDLEGTERNEVRLSLSELTAGR